MVQIIQENKRPSFGARLGAGLERSVQFGSQILQKQQAAEQMQRENQQLQALTGMDFSGITDPKQRQELAKVAMQGMNAQQLEALKGQTKKAENEAQLLKNDAILRDLEIRRELPKGSLNAYRSDLKAAEMVTRPKAEKAPPGGLGGLPIPPEKARTIKKIVVDNPKASAEDLELLFNEAGIEPGLTKDLLESRRRGEEQIKKSEESKLQELRKETLPLRTQLANKAQAASQGIENKEGLLNLIENGDIDDPTYAAIAEALPLKLGKRLLSNDTVEYKAGLIQEYGDLRNLFQGQTRIKEIDLLEEKVADLYLTNDQKKAVIRSRITALKADIIRAEIAQELEKEPYGVLQFQQELEKRAKPKLEALFNRILDENKAIIQDAENMKKIPLSYDDPEGRAIAEQIMKEANGDRTKARAIAKKKGYTLGS